jgi:tRNA1Val (adenine37-N6)-methyltransferase
MKSSSFTDIGPHPHETIDPILDGRLRLIQSKKGYRFSIDSVFLAEFVTIKPGDVVVDLGTGCGVIPVILLLTEAVGHAFGLEIQEELAGQALRNAALNGFRDRMHIVRGDIRFPPLQPALADVVICNPPYRRVREGRINPDPRRAIARHEILASIDDIIRATRHLLKKKGRPCVIYPAVRTVDVLLRLRRSNLEPKRLQWVYPNAQSPAKLSLIEASLGARPGLIAEPPVLGQSNYST